MAIAPKSHKGRGKGSERIFVGIVEGRIERYPTKCHNESDVKPKGVIKAIRRRFKLTEDDGVADKDFYGRAQTIGCNVITSFLGCFPLWIPRLFLSPSPARSFPSPWFASG